MFVSAFYEGHGSFAQECLALAVDRVSGPRRPDRCRAAAGFWIPHLTAWTGLVERGHLAAGEWLAVLGAAGGSGIAAVQLGRALGGRVIAVVGRRGAGRRSAESSVPRSPSTTGTGRSHPRCERRPTAAGST